MELRLNKICTVIVALVFTFCFLGCFDWNDEFYWDGNFSGITLVGFVDDSIAIFTDHDFWNRKGDALVDGFGFGRQRIRGFNYRVQEEYSRWENTLDNRMEEFNYVIGQLSDSVIWGKSDDHHFSFWNIVQKPYRINVKQEYENCSTGFAITRMRTWKNGLQLAINDKESFVDTQKQYGLFNAMCIGEKCCQYAVLDTIKKTLTYKRLTNDLAWLQQCDDVKIFENDIYCISAFFFGNSYLIRNEHDTIATFHDMKRFYGNMIISSRGFCKLDTLLDCFDISADLYLNEYTRNGDYVFRYGADSVIIYDKTNN